MPTLKIDGKEVTVEPGTNLIQAAEQLGIPIPYYCWHPGLTVAGNCRMCLVKMEKSPKPVIACQTQCQDGMVIDASSGEVGKLRKAVLEFLLINHPLDCPVCDQAGECWLQDYYMEHGLYDPKFDEQKVKKHAKAVPIGPNVILDSERCILCSRCVRFCDEISQTSELGIFDRGDHSEIGIYPGRELDNKYSGCTVDICPVGALTDRDFRFKCRVWYLSSTDSICPGCSQGCNIQIHVNKDRPQHGEGERVMRLKPRYNPDVNQWWICDEGRYGYKVVDQNRLLLPKGRDNGELHETEWEELLESLALRLKTFFEQFEKQALGVLVSPQLTNEDLFVARKFFIEGLDLKNVALLSPTPPGDEDRFLIKADKNPNSLGASTIGLGEVAPESIFKQIEQGKMKGLYLFGQDLMALLGPERTDTLLSKLELIIFQGSNVTAISNRAHYLLPSATYAEKEGTLTNGAGRVQRIRQALKPLGKSRPDWKILRSLAEKMGVLFEYQDTQKIFDDLCRCVPAFKGLSYGEIGSLGAVLTEAGK